MNFNHLKTTTAVFLLILMCGPVSAYYLSIEAPAQVIRRVHSCYRIDKHPPPDKIDIVFSIH